MAGQGIYFQKILIVLIPPSRVSIFRTGIEFYFLVRTILTVMKKRLLNTASVWVGSIVLGILGNFLYDYVKQVPILGSITKLFKNLYLLITDTQIKLWAVLVLAVLIFLMTYFVKWIKKKIQQDYASYTTDIFRILRWRWKWRRSAGNWQPVNLQSYCPPCDIELVKRKGINKCPGCNRRYRDELKEDIINLIKARVGKTRP